MTGSASTLTHRGRLAPTPSGYLHIGNARSFLAAWLAARHAKGTVVLRIEDIDRERCRPELEAAQVEDLRWLGLDWDEGPDIGGSCGPYRQSDCLGFYQVALERLHALGRVYPCICTRKEIATAASAPHQGDEPHYPGTCRGKFADATEARKASGREPAWRFRTEAGSASFDDRHCGHTVTDTSALVGDFVVMRRDGWPAYQLAVVVDDGRQGVTQVIRGQDLLDSVARQMELHRLLGYEPPREWAHLGLVVDEHGERLAKRRDGLALRALRERGNRAETVIGVLGHSLGLLARPEPLSARELVAEFRYEAIPHGPWRLDSRVFL